MTVINELITGPIGSGKTFTVRQRLADEINAPNTQTWVIDLYTNLPDWSSKADRYARTPDAARMLLQDACAEIEDRAARIAELGLPEFVAGDEKHGLHLVVITIEETQAVLDDLECVRLVERMVRMGRKVGLKTRMTNTARPGPTAFGGSLVIAEQMAAGDVTELPGRSVVGGVTGRGKSRAFDEATARLVTGDSAASDSDAKAAT
ncbi:hypothetical protein [Thermomonospora umbrina]|uniref:hypothetical protein n=1 Tax=Thermomonospora umbrina TaxID=111806 RepID=UPI0011C103FC|nr:hypothetical protein [Thermomonospora umbrina]